MSIVYEIGYANYIFWIHFRNWMRYNLYIYIYIYLELRKIYVCVMNNCLGKNNIIHSLVLTVVFIFRCQWVYVCYMKKIGIRILYFPLSSQAL